MRRARGCTPPRARSIGEGKRSASLRTWQDARVGALYFAARDERYLPLGIIGMHIIIGMPPHIIIVGAPIAIMAFIASQRSFMRGIIEGSIGIIFIIMPSFVISQDIRHIIGIIPPPIMGIIMGIIMPFIGIMPFIIGIMPPIMPLPIIGIMPPIIGIIPFIGMVPIGMVPIGMLFIGIPIIEPLIIGMAFIDSSSIASLK